MAMSAFKSTTKRTAIGAGNESDNAYTGVPFQPSTPFKNKRGHRRTQSFTNLSSNDANSMHLDSLFQEGRRQLSSRYQSDCESESDADSMYSRHTYRSLQKAEIGASRKAALQKPKREDKRRSPSVERSYKEIADFLSFLPDDPLDASHAAAEVLPIDDITPGRRPVVDANHAYQSDDPESVISRLARPRRGVDAQSDTESLVSHFARARRGSDAQSDTECVFSRLTQPRRRAFDAKSDMESNVFSRLAQPRQSAGAGAGVLGPPRTGANTIQNGRAKVGVRAGALRRSTSQVDLPSSSFRGREDHSDTESLYSSHTNRSRSGRETANFGQSSSIPARKKGTRQASLRHSTSQIEFSDNASLEGFRLPSSRAQDGKDTFRLSSRAQDYEDSPEEAFFEMEHDLSPLDGDTPGGHPEEEKTIRAVHTQNKEPRAQELDAISLYDAMRAEMRKAVSEIRMELEQKSVSKDLVLATPSLGEDLRITVPKEDDDEETSVSEVRREYAAKLEQSEKRAQDLWTQLAAEERRCLDLVKYVKELLPAQAGGGLQPPAPPPPPSRSLMGPEGDQQLVSQCLDADAQRYFEECVSIAGLDTISGLDIVSVNDGSSCGAGYQESENGWSVKDLPFSPRRRSAHFWRADDKNVAVLQPLKVFCAQIEQSGKCIGKSSNLFVKAPMSEDGLVLPWLQWETKPDYSLEEQIGLKGNHAASSSRSKALSGVQDSNDEQDAQPFNLPPGVSGLGCLSNGDLSSWKSIDFGHLRNVDSRFTRVDVEMFVLQRSSMRHHIIGGRIHICGGIRF